MHKPVRLSLLTAFFTGLLFFGGSATAYDPKVYDNLLRSRDALLEQRAHLQRAYDDVHGQVSVLQDKLGRISTYLKENDKALRDVDYALRQVR